jgi:hypothetical protein
LFSNFNETDLKGYIKNHQDEFKIELDYYEPSTEFRYEETGSQDFYRFAASSMQGWK